MPSGVPWKEERVKIIDALKRSDGVLSHAAKALNVHPHTLHNHIQKDEELKKLMHDLRYGYDVTLLDGAESVLKKAIDGIDLDKALKSAFFVLNNKGAERGYSAKNNPNNPSAAIEDQLAKFREDIASAQDVPRASEPQESEVEDGEPLLDQEQAGSEDSV